MLGGRVEHAGVGQPGQRIARDVAAPVGDRLEGDRAHGSVRQTLPEVALDESYAFVPGGRQRTLRPVSHQLHTKRQHRRLRITEFSRSGELVFEAGLCRHRQNSRPVQIHGRRTDTVWGFVMPSATTGGGNCCDRSDCLTIKNDESLAPGGQGKSVRVIALAHGRLRHPPR
jgi:hypothetical protein